MRVELVQARLVNWSQFDLPVAIFHASVLVDGDRDALADFTFHDLDGTIFMLFAAGSLATCAVVGRNL